MPTASDFDLAAYRFDRAAASLGSWTAGMAGRFHPDTLSGGALALACDEMVARAERTARVLRHELDERARLCRERAAACRAHDAAMNRHRMAEAQWRSIVAGLSDGVSAPVRPVPPLPPSYAD